MIEIRSSNEGNSYFIKAKLTNIIEEENQNDTINSIKFEVENKTVTLIEDIETPEPLSKKISSETIKVKYVSMEMFDTFYNYYIKEVYRMRNTIYKNSYCKSLIILFIWLIAFSRCSQLFLCGNPLA